VDGLPQLEPPDVRSSVQVTEGAPPWRARHAGPPEHCPAH
jgi:hypothetical protein